ncbi:MAG: ATP-binding protein [Cyclobacteriaceae bacterium]
MKSTSEVLKTYEDLIAMFLYFKPTDSLENMISGNLMAYGTAEHEIIRGHSDLLAMINTQVDEMKGVELEHNRKMLVNQSLAGGNTHLFVEEITIKIVAEDYSFLMRMSTLFEFLDKKWVLSHFHASTPDSNISEGEALPIQAVRKKNLELEKLIKKRTEELSESLENLKSTQTQLIHSEKMASLGELTAGIAHEIQNPLNFVNNFSEINKELIEELEEEMKKGDKVEIKEIFKDLRDNEEKVAHHGKRAEGIVKSMLQHSRTGSGEKEPTDINALCDEYLRLAYHGFRAKDKSFNADINTELDPDLPKINVVPQDIGRVLLNLINNAFQAVSAVASAKADGDYKPLVTIQTKHMSTSGGSKGEVNITITDNGPGIPEDIKDKIFQPFFTTKPTGEGTGLGLSMSYDIVTKGHAGSLEVRTNKGAGSEFLIKLKVNSTK